MKKFTRFFAIAVSLLFVAFNLSAQTAELPKSLEIPSAIGDNMVLQQNSTVNIWGYAKPKAKVSVACDWIAGKPVSVKADAEGVWIVPVAVPAASFDPHTVTIKCGKEVVTLSNILFGEVWLCSGQSNMEMPMKGFGRQPVEQSLEYIMESGKFKNKIRMFTVTRNRSFEKDEWDCKGGEWQCATPKATADMSATTYFFARNIIDNVDFPIGIITSNWGGTRIESWMPKQALIEVLAEDGYEAAQKKHSIKPTELYCAMLAPIRQFNAKGFLWYQGCSNLGDVTTYDKLQARMVKQWREDWGDKENAMPFYYVMIAPYIYKGSDEIAYPLFVENQVRALSKIPNCGMAATTDIGEERCIHPAQKFEVGQRLAALALAQTYGQQGFEHKAPQMAAYEIKDGKVTVYFTNASMGLYPWYDQPVVGFEIAGADKKFYPAEARTVANDRVSVWSSQVKEPVAIRYAFRNYMKQTPNLKNMYNIPAVPFRTDDWNDVR